MQQLGNGVATLVGQHLATPKRLESDRSHIIGVIIPLGAAILTGTMVYRNAGITATLTAKLTGWLRVVISKI
jgi:hypothetical protein